jgi:hypothetical protein
VKLAVDDGPLSDKPSHSVHVFDKKGDTKRLSPKFNSVIPVVIVTDIDREWRSWRWF